LKFEAVELQVCSCNMVTLGQLVSGQWKHGKKTISISIWFAARQIS